MSGTNKSILLFLLTCSTTGVALGSRQSEFDPRESVRKNQLFIENERDPFSSQIRELDSLRVSSDSKKQITEKRNHSFQQLHRKNRHQQLKKYNQNGVSSFRNGGLILEKIASSVASDQATPNKNGQNILNNVNTPVSKNLAFTDSSMQLFGDTTEKDTTPSSVLNTNTGSHPSNKYEAANTVASKETSKQSLHNEINGVDLVAAVPSNAISEYNQNIDSEPQLGDENNILHEQQTENLDASNVDNVLFDNHINHNHISLNADTDHNHYHFGSHANENHINLNPGIDHSHLLFGNHDNHNHINLSPNIDYSHYHFGNHANDDHISLSTGVGNSHHYGDNHQENLQALQLAVTHQEMAIKHMQQILKSNEFLIRKQESTIKDLISEVHSMKAVNYQSNYLSDHSKIHEDRLKNLEAQMKFLSDRTSSHDQCLKKAEDSIVDVKHTLEMMKIQFQANRKLLDHTNTRLQEMKRQYMTSMVPQQQKTVVAFTVYASKTHEYRRGDILQFDGTVFNIGGHFNALNSIFTCPITGYYLFSVNILACNGYPIDFSLRINGKLMVSSYARDNVNHDQASTTFVAKCEQIQKVAVICDQNGSHMFGNSGRYSTFTGIMLTSS